jgi:hypothetical protein
MRKITLRARRPCAKGVPLYDTVITQRRALAAYVQQ